VDYATYGTSTVENVIDLNFLIAVIVLAGVAINYIVVTQVLSIDLLGYFKKFVLFILGGLGKKIAEKEKRYNRDLEVGKIDYKTKKVIIYRFYNELIIDLGIKKKGCTPYEFMWFTIAMAILLGIMTSEFVFQKDNIFFISILSVISFIAEMSFLYTKANIAHDKRIDAVIESENVICNDITKGVVVGVRNSLPLMPEIVREEFKVFLDNVENKNYHIKTALQELNNNLGSIADEFIKQCIVFELEEEHGIAGMFQDIVAVNNIKTELRNSAKRKYEETMNQFLMGAGMVMLFLGGSIAIYPELSEFYLHNSIGQVLLCCDFLILLLEYVYITKMKAKKVG
jgi:hypothetical protein